MKTYRILGIALLALGLTGITVADEAADMAAMQKKLNAEVAEQPFSAEDEAKIDLYIRNALKDGITPPEYRGSHWQPGWTCRNLRRYSWSEYRSCRYYRRYHGRYYY